MVCTVPNGVSPRYAVPQEGPAPRKDPADHASLRTCLYVGRADPYKNLDGLLRAFARAKGRLPFPLQLVIAGPRDDRYPEAPALAEQLNVAADVCWTGYLSDRDLLHHYQTADLLALPSRCEGFGLPVIEAMACGTPCLCSTAPALKEIAQGAALFAGPDDLEGMAQGIQDILTRPDLAADLARRGIARAAEFTWQRTAEQTLAVYERAASLPGGRS
jgi:glycosyltransferase involved in cell wall biosynthesis